jgi:hypothetical protein
MKLRDYIILRRETADMLTEAANAYINQGWSPQGGIAMTPGLSEGETVWAQAFIRDNPTQFPAGTFDNTTDAK